MPVGNTRARIALFSAAGALVVSAGLTGCGASAGDDAKPAAATSSPAAKKAAKSKPSPKASPKPSPLPLLGLVDDEESTDAAKAIVVKVLANDTVSVAGQPAERIEAALDAGEFALSVGTSPKHGTAKVDGATIVYTSARGYGGEDEFTYRIDLLDQEGTKGTKGAKTGPTGPTGTAVVRLSVTAPPPPPTPTPTPVKTKTKNPVPPPVSYANCTAVKAAGAAPIRIGEPGYGRHLDRDGDGIGCE